MKSLNLIILAAFLFGSSLALSQEKLSKEFIVDLNGDGFPEKSAVYKINGKPELRIIDGKNPSFVEKYQRFPKFMGLYLGSGKKANHLFYIVDVAGDLASGFDIFYDSKDRGYRSDFVELEKKSNPEFFSQAEF